LQLADDRGQADGPRGLHRPAARKNFAKKGSFFLLAGRGREQQMLLTAAAAFGLSPDSKFGGDHEAHANAHIWQTLNTQAASAPEPYRPPVPMRRAMDRNWTVAAVPVATEPEAFVPAEQDEPPIADQLHDGRDVLANVAQQQLPAVPPKDESSLLRDVDESAQRASDGTDTITAEVPPEELVSAPPSLNAALNQANEASAAAAMPVFPNVDLEVLEETQAKMDITKFVVLSQARSGSTWLVSMLNSHPNVLASGEYLSSWAGPHVDGDGLVCKPQERLAKLDNINDWKQCSEWNFADKRKWVEAAKTGPVAMGLCVHTRPTGKAHLRPRHTHDLVAPYRSPRCACPCPRQQVVQPARRMGPRLGAAPRELPHRRMSDLQGAFGLLELDS
jgi:hypothetical protein